MRTLRCRSTVFASLVTVGALAGCGGGDDGDSEGGGESNAEADRIAQCIDATGARAGTAESAVEGAVGAVSVSDPSTVVHVFETEAAAKAHADEQDELDKKAQVGKTVVYSDDPAVIALVKGCV